MTSLPPPEALTPSYAVEIPTMKSLFIEMRRGDMVLATGTGFLVANDRESHCAFVTARHNVTGRHQDTGQCLSAYGAIPDAITIYFHKGNESIGAWTPITLPLYRDGSPWWFEHPVLGDKADVVALNLRWGDDVTRFPYYLKTELDRPKLVISPAEPVSVIGFPFGLSSSLRFPIWATGFLAQELSLVTQENPVFLIDCRTRPGQSGAAVIAFRVGSHRTIAGGRIASTLTGQTVWEFLGIYTGRINAESDLGRVWHVRVLEDLLAVATEGYSKRDGDEAVASSPRL
ncbi:MULTISPECIES: trypsin-like peptidase domain-containing protein [Bradyrhizobium]|jgi:hypothetical protein|uniref:trypsin-like serine peptidase n=1 Tax=Bradyrhizobium TaxID=374 RepID=UPI0004631647|nr:MULTISPECIES: trypsin-like peptidase domain-containing protein [Bradyrhizobium]KIU52349.1 hypothetical protein QU41_03045 [Bradyrhizobium elkanii]OCX32883.1 hypothetical protein QU42_01540 [Bradyrhizobium sp. UASWS1016]